MTSQPYTASTIAFNGANELASGPCNCCPYGFHIDTDFVRYCDALLTALYGSSRNFPDAACRSYSSLRRKFNLALTNPEVFISPAAKSLFPYHDLSPKANAPLSNGNFNFYRDKERSFSFKDRYLEHSLNGHGHKQGSYSGHFEHFDSPASTEPDSTITGDSESMLSEAVDKFEEVLLESISLSKSNLTTTLPPNVHESPPPSPAPSSCPSSVSKSVLTQIRNHLALSLTRVQELESQVAQIPYLREQITQLLAERDELLKKVTQQSIQENAHTKEQDLIEARCTLKRLSPIGRDDDVEPNEEFERDSSILSLNNKSLSCTSGTSTSPPIQFSFSKCESISIQGTCASNEVSTRSVGTLTSFAPSLPPRNACVQTDLQLRDVIARGTCASVGTCTDVRNKQAACQISPGTAHATTDTSDFDLNTSISRNEFMNKNIECQDASVQVLIPTSKNNSPSSCYDKGVSTEELSCSKVDTDQTLANLVDESSIFSPKLTESISGCSPSSSSQSIRLCDKCNEMVNSVTTDNSCSQEMAISLPKIIKSDSGILVERRQTDCKTNTDESEILVSDFEMSSSLNTQSSDEQEQSSKAKPTKKPIDYSRLQPNSETKAALKVINEHLLESKKSSSFIFSKNVSSIKKVWFKISSTQDSDPRVVELYLDCFEKFSSKLLDYVVNLSDTNGNTAMHYAISYNNFDIVSVLLDSKVCDVNKYNKAGYTATMLVSLAKIENDIYRDVVDRLFHQADVNLKAKQNQQSALMLAASHGNFELCKILLECGAEVNLQDKDGSSALMCAAEHGHANIISLLLSHPDCDPLMEDNEGSTALKIALINGHNEAGILLYTGTRITNYYASSCYSSLGRLPNSSIYSSHLRRAGSFSYSPGNTSHNSSALSLRTSPPRNRHYSMSTPSSPSHT